MTFDEAMERVNEGKFVRRPHWGDGIRVTRGNIVIRWPNGAVVNFEAKTADQQADDWLVEELPNQIPTA